MDVGTAPNTLESLRLAQANAIEAADSVGATFEAGINVFDNVAEIYTLEGTALRSDLEGAGKSLPSAVNIVEVGRLSENAASIYGGLSLNKCITGFAVENSDGTLGITTAAHCEGDLYRDGKPLTKQDQYWGESGDVKWLTAPDFTVENKIRVRDGTREITGIVERDDQPIAQYICKQGKWTGYTCGHIADTSFLPTNDCPGQCTWNATFVRVQASTGQKLVDHEDSGGPFFHGQTAWGTTVSKLEIPVPDDEEGWVRTDAIYMPIDYVEVMGVEVLTD